MSRLLIAFALTSTLHSTPARGQHAATEGPEGVEAPSELDASSEMGAGLDDTAVGEVLHPTTRAPFALGVRMLGSPLQDGQGVIALQLNPYLASWGETRSYSELTAERSQQRWGPLIALLQDATVALSLRQGTPFEDSRGSSRYVTLGAGLSLELLGQRSLYGPRYSACLDQTSQRYAVDVLNLPLPRPGEPAVEYERALEAVSRKVDAAVRACEATFDGSQALFFSAGARWVLPGPERQDGDSARIQHSYAALSYDLRWEPLVVTAQARVLGTRPALAASTDIRSDAGLSLRWRGSKLVLMIEATHSIGIPGSADSQATLAALVRYTAKDKVGLSFGLKGAGESPRAALHSAVVGLTVSYEGRAVVSAGPMAAR
ncbi:hypothetical protein [Hyalangium versicolor]|uniref:hypothetical protein n=1 Tax=Hyalangium versicolor TaxID=2861190 RepID=UPI001CCF02B6|nr:hypothetical protein [Hyalangium versicolor]